MPKIAFIGAGSTVFARNIIGDCLLAPALAGSHFALYDIDAERLEDSRRMVETLNRTVAGGKARVTAHLGVSERRAALSGADYVVNAIQVGGYRPSTVIDFEIPNRYGLRQTIADTLGIGGIFRGLRTIPVLMDIAADIEAVCPGAWLLNYTNPMSMLTMALLRRGVKAVGLCHSVQLCVPKLLSALGMEEGHLALRWKIAGINHMAWLLELSDGDRDLYPEVKRRAAEKNAAALADPALRHGDMVRYELMKWLGYYVTESSEHNAEYSPYWIKAAYPELIDRFNIPLDEYPRRCEKQIADWKILRGSLVEDPRLEHRRTFEYGSFIMEAMETGTPYAFGGNVLNAGVIGNLPADAVVEVTCLADRNGIQPCVVGRLPPQCAALNTTNVNVQLLTVEAALTGRRDHIYQAAMLDPHTAAELSLDDIRALVDDLIEAHGAMLPAYR